MARLKSQIDDPSWWEDGDILMAVELGYDEGGGGDTLLVSVQLSVPEQNKKLKRAWDKRLPENLPYFHSKDFNNYTSGVFTKAGLARKERTALLSDLCGLVHRHLLCAITAEISISEYEKLTTRDFRSRFGTAYACAINMCLIGAYSYSKKMGYEPSFNILIEGGHRNSNQVAQILQRLKTLSEGPRGRDIIPDIKILTAGIGEKKDHPILQAADMVAHSEWQRISKRDPTIWRALHPYGNFENKGYYTASVRCDGESINTFAEPAPKKYRKT